MFRRVKLNPFTKIDIETPDGKTCTVAAAALILQDTADSLWEKEGDEYFVELDSDFKPNNIKNLKKAVETFTLDGNSKVKSTLYYNQNKRLSQSYFEYDNNQIAYVKSDYKTHPDGLIILVSRLYLWK